MTDKRQSKKEYLQALLKEYLQAELRMAIYPKDRDKEYYARVAEHKEQKIIDICEDINVSNPFEDESLMAQYRAEIGHVLSSKEDYRNYYERGSHVRIRHVGIYTEGTVEAYAKNKVTVICDAGCIDVHPKDVVRIL